MAAIVAAWQNNVEVLKGRAITSLFTVIRDKDASTADYITHADRLLNLLAEETLAQHATPHTVTTPCGTYEGLKPCPATQLCAVSIVRSGDILLEATRRACLGIAGHTSTRPMWRFVLGGGGEEFNAAMETARGTPVDFSTARPI